MNKSEFLKFCEVQLLTREEKPEGFFFLKLKNGNISEIIIATSKFATRITLSSHRPDERTVKTLIMNQKIYRRFREHCKLKEDVNNVFLKI